MREGGFVDRFQSGLRTDPAPLVLVIEGSVPTIYTKGVTTYDSAPFPGEMGSTGRDPGLGSAGPVLGPQGSSGEKGLSRCARGEMVDRFQSGLRTDPAPLVLGGSAGIGGSAGPVRCCLGGDRGGLHSVTGMSQRGLSNGS